MTVECHTEICIRSNQCPVSSWFLGKISATAAASFVSGSVQPYGLQPARLLCPWNSLGKSSRLGCHALLQGVFPTERSNLRCRQVLYHLSYQGSPGKISRAGQIHTASVTHQCETLCLEFYFLTTLILIKMVISLLSSITDTFIWGSLSPAWRLNFIWGEGSSESWGGDGELSLRGRTEGGMEAG